MLKPFLFSRKNHKWEKNTKVCHLQKLSIGFYLIIVFFVFFVRMSHYSKYASILNLLYVLWHDAGVLSFLFNDEKQVCETKLNQSYSCTRWYLLS